MDIFTKGNTWDVTAQQTYFSKLREDRPKAFGIKKNLPLVWEITVPDLRKKFKALL